MLQFFKFSLATVVGLFIFILLTITLLGIFASGSGDDVPKVEDNSILVLRLNTNIKEKSEKDPFDGLDLPISIGSDGAVGVIEVRQAIKKAATDTRIKGIYLNMQFVQAGFATIQEIRDELVAFKKTGKFVYAYGEVISEGAYYLVSVADKIYLNPEGLIEFNGLSSEVTFIKGTLEKLEVQPLIFRVGDFKSAIEPLLLDKMSDANKKQVTSYLNSIYGEYLKNVSISRKIDYQTLKTISDSMLVRNANDALNYKLATHIGYEDEALDDIKKALKIEKKDKIKQIGLKNYIKVAQNDIKLSDNRVAVLVSEGEIVSGKGDGDNIGSDAFVTELRKLSKDKKVKAIVLRINSPGGSALASDVMWREIQLCRKEKPVIASMSDVAASGGYYMAMGCDTIVAQPNTITGSIGVFGVLFNAEKLLKNKIGVTTDRVSTGSYSDVGNPAREMTDAEKMYIQKEVERVYDGFTAKAAKGRRMSVENLKAIASGRVWTGLQGKENGLVDVIGGLDVAVDIAAKKAKIDKDYSVKYYPQGQDFFTKLLNKNAESTKENAIKAELGELYPYIKQARDLKYLQKGVQARMEYNIIIK